MRCEFVVAINVYTGNEITYECTHLPEGTCFVVSLSKDVAVLFV